MSQILDRVLTAARQLGASDVHLKAGLPPIFRIKGDLRTVRDVPPLTREAIAQFAVHMMNDREIGFDTMSFGRALRAALRQDPDVILVGEMRDFETAQIAMTAAETGHLVLSTLHTVDATETVSRIISMFPTHQQQQARLTLPAELL